ncbi:MAG: hypothetical protein H6767_03725 [Candidatus Peribacteria bacterium]|nr:MAG: hypothetical protein H6767_03725 [Candidatus Peribacteria bacterium]
MVKKYTQKSHIILDNFQFSCIGGGGSCGWTDGTMENGSMNPWDVFNFSGYSSLPWNQSTNASEGTYAITSPIMPDGGYS